MIAQVPMSPEWSSPVSWAELFSRVGVPAGLFIVMFLAGVFIIYKGCKWTIGPDGWLKKQLQDANDARVLMTDEIRLAVREVKDSMVTQQTSLVTQLEHCRKVHEPGGAANVSDLRHAGIEAASILEKIGHEVGADVAEHARVIRGILENKGAA